MYIAIFFKIKIFWQKNDNVLATVYDIGASAFFAAVPGSIIQYDAIKIKALVTDQTELKTFYVLPGSDAFNQINSIIIRNKQAIVDVIRKLEYLKLESSNTIHTPGVTPMRLAFEQTIKPAERYTVITKIKDVLTDYDVLGLEWGENHYLDRVIDFLQKDIIKKIFIMNYRVIFITYDIFIL